MTRRALPALLLAALGAAGCYSDPATGAIRFGRRPAGPTPDQVAIQRLQSENEELRTELRNLRFQVDGVGSSMSSVAARSDELSQASDARGQDVVAIRTDLSGIERRIASLETRMGNVPSAISAAVEKENQSMRAEVSRSVAASEERMRAAIAAAARSPEPSPSVRSGNGYEYVIKRGDTLSDIARDFHVSVRDIMTANNISDASRIREGQTIFVPAN